MLGLQNRSVLRAIYYNMNEIARWSSVCSNRKKRGLITGFLVLKVNKYMLNLQTQACQGMAQFLVSNPREGKGVFLLRPCILILKLQKTFERLSFYKKINNIFLVAPFFIKDAKNHRNRLNHSCWKTRFTSPMQKTWNSPVSN